MIAGSAKECKRFRKGDCNMNEDLAYLRDCGTFYLATSADGQPRVRPFGAVCAFEGGLYIVTNNQKEVYRQMKANPKVEICGMHRGTWIRLEGEVAEDERREARAAMMEANRAALSGMYTIDDGRMTVFRFVRGAAKICAFTAEPRTFAL